jgi:sugar phosphate isomerase/epimerase
MTDPLTPRELGLDELDDVSSLDVLAERRPTNVVAGSTLALAVRPLVTDGRLGARETWAAELRQLRSCGFDAVDLVDAWVSPAALSESALEELLAAFGETGLTITGLSIVRRSVIDPDAGDENLDFTLRSVNCAKRIGCSTLSVGLHRPLTPLQKRQPFWMVPGPVDERDDATYDKAAQRLRQIADAAYASGLTVALELYEGTLLDSGQSALRLLDAIGRENVGINFDLGNLVRVPGPMPETWQATLGMCASRVNYVHAKNYFRLEHPATGSVMTTPSPLGDGEIDWRDVIRTLVSAGYAGPICIEHYGGDPFWAMHVGRQYLTHVLESLAS